MKLTQRPTLVGKGFPLAILVCCLSGGGWTELPQGYESPPEAPPAPLVVDAKIPLPSTPIPKRSSPFLLMAERVPVAPVASEVPSTSTEQTAADNPGTSPTVDSGEQKSVTEALPDTLPSSKIERETTGSVADAASVTSEDEKPAEAVPTLAGETQSVGKDVQPSQTVESERKADADPGDTGERSNSTSKTVPPAGSNEPVPEALANPPQTAAAPAESSRAAPPSKPRLPLDAKSQFLRDRLVRCLQFYYQKNLNTGEVSAWSVMHAALSFGVDSRVHRDGPQGPLVNALGWLCWNGDCRGRKMMVWKEDHLDVLEGPGFQGHPAQFLAVLAQCQVGRDFELRVDGRSATVQDLVAREMSTCRPDMELTFKLIGLSHYLASDTTWTSEQGETWNIPRLIEIELASPLNGVACGGTHRMMGLSYAVRRRESRNEPVDGAWAHAKQRVQQYIDRTYWLQNPDGSFSSQWYQRKADWGDTDRKLQTTGHMLEWLVFSLPEDQLNDPRVVRSVSFLTELMINNRYYEWENGPRGHALRSLMVYANRRFGLQVKDYVSQMVAKPSNGGNR